MRLLRLCLSVIFVLSVGVQAEDRKVTPVPEAFRDKVNLSDFYQKYTQAGPLPILGSDKVSDYALLEATWLVDHVIGHRPDILQALADKGVRMVIMAYNEYTTDLPEQADMSPKDYWDRRARGLGGRVISGAEENLLAYPGDPYRTENILIHEFAHVIQGTSMREVDPTFNRRLRAAYEDAKSKGLWKDTYAGSNVAEYWAEGVQDWFDNNRENDGIHNHVNTRVELKVYDPNLAGLCAEVLGEGTWKYAKPMDRPEQDRAHLKGYDTAQHSFSICVGDQPNLDFAGKRQPDGQGFAAFGKVISGMDVVRKIHARPAQGQQLTPAIQIKAVDKVSSNEKLQ